MRLYPAFQTTPIRTDVFQSNGAPPATIASRRYPQFLEADRVMRVWELPSGTVGAGTGRLSRLTLMGAG